MSLKASDRIVATGLGLLFCLRAGVALAQTPPSLAELAQKEQERKKALKGAATKVYSDKDLPKTATPPIASTVPSPTVVPAESKPAEAKPEDQKDETWWRNRMQSAGRRPTPDRRLLFAGRGVRPGDRQPAYVLRRGGRRSGGHGFQAR